MTFEAEVRCLVFARVYVEAKSEEEARKKINYGGTGWDSAEFEMHTARTEDVESVTNLDAPEKEEA